MIRLLILLALLPAASVRALPPSAPGAIISAGQTDAEWKPLFASLAAKGGVISQFSERRWFPFRREPVLLFGEMRFAPDAGLSLHYTSPENRTVIVDAHGLAIRTADGQSSPVAPDPRAAAVTGALLPILRFDQAELLKNFTVRGARDHGDWRLDFTPLDATLERMLGSIVVLGSGDAVRDIEFYHSEKQRIEIVIGETKTGVVFGAADRKRYFR